MLTLRNAETMARVSLLSLRNEGTGFFSVWLRARDSVPGWLSGPDARTLYALAHHGPGEGAIVEIGSAWGKSTIFLASGSKRAGRERVFAIDPHTGDPTYLEQDLSPFWPPRRRLPFTPAPDISMLKPTHGEQFTSYEAFQRNLQRFRLDDWVVPIVSTSEEASRSWNGTPIRLLFVDGLHSYEGVSIDIRDWVPRVIRGGVIVFDDYFTHDPTVGVSRAVDELVASGAVSSPQHEGGIHVWVYKH